MAKDKLICNCNQTMPLDGKVLARALKLGTVPVVHTELCRKHLSAFEAAVKNGNDLVVACTQEAPLFDELHDGLSGKGAIQFVNIRETAGWSAESKQAAPKIAALLALADVPDPAPVPLVSYQSAGELLITGPAARALPWAEQLAEQFGVSVLLTDAKQGELPSTRRYPLWSGNGVVLKGYLGAFEAQWEQANPIDLELCTRCNACIHACPEQAIDYSYQIDLDKCKAHRQCVNVCGAVKAIDFERAERSRGEHFDLVLDLHDRPLLDMPQPPQGYFAPGSDALALARAVRELGQMASGEFEKPKYFEYKEKICAHGRSEIKGCTNCIDVCSTRAISSDLAAHRILVEPHLCMGCGGCATVCPSGAMTYAYPRVADAGLRIKTVLQVYREAGGENPCLLFHNTTDGRELIARLARRGKGLPANVIPLEVFHVASLGLDLMLGAIALGAARVSVLPGSEPSDYRKALERQMGYAEEIMTGLGLGAGRFRLIAAGDPVGLERSVWETQTPSALTPATFNLTNEKRATLDFVFDHLLRHAPARKEELPLSTGAPYGRVVVDKAKCTMCLACVGACPEGALLDAKDKPQLRFIERNCVQCGLCEKTCPEDAITLVPRLLLSSAATQPTIVNEDKIFACVRCGKPFANQRIIDNMMGKLAAHSMFKDPGALRRLQMCQDCRVIDMFEKNDGGTIFDVTGKKE